MHRADQNCVCNGVFYSSYISKQGPCCGSSCVPIPLWALLLPDSWWSYEFTERFVKTNSLWPSDQWRHRAHKHLFRWWFIAWRHQNITWTNVDYQSARSCCTQKMLISLWNAHLRYISLIWVWKLLTQDCSCISQGPMPQVNLVRNI